VLAEVEDVGGDYQVVVDRKDGRDSLEVRVEVSPDLFSRGTGDVRHLVRTQNLVRQRLEAMLGLAVQVSLVEPRTLEGPSGRPQRILDRRREEGR